HDGVSIHDDFFNDLAGDSLNAAELISLLREEPVTAHIAVRDLYETRTVAGLTTRADEKAKAECKVDEARVGSEGRPILATSIQITWLLIGLLVGSSAAYLAAFDILPDLISILGLIPFVLLTPFITFAVLLIYIPIAVLLLVLVKQVLIG